MSSSDLDNGLKSLKKAEEFSKSSVLAFRFKPDWDQTARFAKDASGYLRRAGPKSVDTLIKALRLSAQAHENINAFNQAALDLEEVADILVKLPSAEMLTESISTYKAASRLFRLNNQSERAASLLMKGAKAAEEGKDPKVCKALMDAACGIFEDEDRATHSEQTFKTAINYALKIGDYEYAHDVIARQNIIYRKRLDMFEQDIYKNFLAQIILYLGTGKLREARNALTAQELAPDAANYGRSDPYAAAVDLLNCIEKSPEELDAVRKRHQIFKFLDNGIAKMVMKLDVKAIPGAGSLGASTSSTAAFADHTPGGKESDEINLA